jgi:MFS family permease
VAVVPAGLEQGGQGDLRWQAGKHGDRYGHARLLVPALAVAALGMAAMMVLGSPVVIFAGMVLFGTGFGVIENATFALLIERPRLRPARCGTSLTTPVTALARPSSA